METDYTIDTVGRFCPVPIIETANKMKEMRVGETLTVISDDEGIKSDMPSWCAMTGHEFLGMSETGGEIRVFIRKAVEGTPNYRHPNVSSAHVGDPALHNLGTP